MNPYLKLTLLNAANKNVTPGIYVRVEDITGFQEATEIERGAHPQANAILHMRNGNGYLVRENVATILAKLQQAELGQTEESA